MTDDYGPGIEAYGAANRRLLIDGFWIEERAWASAKDGDAIRCSRVEDMEADAIRERGYRRRGWGDAFVFSRAEALRNAKKWWVEHGCEFQVPCKRSFFGRLFYLAGIFLKQLSLEKRYARTG